MEEDGEEKVGGPAVTVPPGVTTAPESANRMRYPELALVLRSLVVVEEEEA